MNKYFREESFEIKPDLLLSLHTLLSIHAQNRQLGDFWIPTLATRL